MKFFLSIVPSLIGVAFLTLLERKLLGLVGYRLGPYKVSIGGILQPIFDAGKLMNKEFNLLSNFNLLFYYFSSLSMLIFSMFLVFNMALSSYSFFFTFSIGFIFLILGLNSLNSILSGWSIYSKFSLLGSLRTVSQLVSYEVLIYMCVFFVLMVYFDFDLPKNLSFEKIGFLSLFLPFIFFIWMMSILAELNRTPYDFSEGESELVSGFNVEFGSCAFTLIFLAEYGMILFFMVLTSFFFFFDLILFMSFFFLFFVVWIRSVLPRYRFDKLMNLSWKILLPFSAFLFIFSFVFLFF